MLPLNLNIVSKIKIGNTTFFSKGGYHVSLIHLEGFLKSDQKKFFTYASKYPIKLKKITSTYRLVVAGNRQSIIVRVHVQGIRKLILALNRHFNHSFAHPPSHITLFTLKNMEGGIGLNSISEYRKLTHQINQKDSQRLSQSFKLIPLHLAM